MKYINLIRKNGFLDFLIITIISSGSLFPKQLFYGVLIFIFHFIYAKFVPKKFDEFFLNKEYILIIIYVSNYIHLINISNVNILFLLFLIFLYLDKLLIKLQLGSKLIISNFILKEIAYEGKYLSKNFITGNAVEFFIINSLFLLNTLQLMFKQGKHFIDILMIIIGLLPLYSIMYHFLYLWHHFIQCLYYFFCTRTIFFFLYWFLILLIFFHINSSIIQKFSIRKIIKRKIYHFLGFIILVPGIIFLDRIILKLILMIVSYLFIVFEVIRNINSLNKYNTIKNINDFMKTSIDERDDNEFIVTHIFLMTGLISSLYYDFKNSNYFSYLSVIILCIGDSMCCIFGVYFGKNKIYSLNNRTLEGSLGGYFSSIIVYTVLKSNMPNIQELVKFLLIFIYEGYTLEIDNLVLPLLANNLFVNYDSVKSNIYKLFN